MEPFGLLLIGGNQTHQENYARAFAADPRCRLIGLTDEATVSARRRELNQDLADELGIPHFVSLDDAIHRHDVRLVSICAEPERRFPISMACLEAGKHIYFDKDPAPTVREARQIASAAAQAGVLTQAFSMVRSTACQRAKACLAGGGLGEVIGLHCDMTFAKGPAGTARLDRPRVEQPDPVRFSFHDSKREFLCVGYYPLILFQWLTGRRFIDVDAVTANWFFEAHQQNDAEDFGSALLRMEGGIETVITAGRTGWTSHRGFGIHQIRLIGTRGTLTLDGHQPRLEVCCDAAPWTAPAAPHPEDPMGFWTSTQAASGVVPKRDWQTVEPPVRSDAACFLDCLEQGRPSDVPVEMAVHAVEVVHAVYRSAAGGQAVSIDGAG